MSESAGLTAHAPLSSEQLKKKLLLNSVVSIGAKVIYLLSRLALPPIILAYVSLDEYGLWSYCFVVMTYMAMTTMGFSMVFILAGAQFTNTGDLKAMNEIASTGFWMSLGVGVLLTFLGALLLPWIVHSLHLSAELEKTATWLLIGTGLSFLLSMTIGSVGTIIIGLQKIVAEQTIWVLSFLLETAVLVGLLQQGQGVYSLLYAFAARYVFSLVVTLFFLYRWVPGFSVHPRYCSRSALRSFLGYGSIIQISGFIATAVRSAERMLAGWLLNVKSVALLDLGQKFPMMSMSLPSSINGSIVPMAAALHGQGKHEDINQLFVSGTRHVNFFAAYLGAYFFGFAGLLVNTWLGQMDALQDIVFVMMVFSLPYHLDVATGPASSILRAIGKPTLEILYNGSQLLFVIAFIVLGRMVFSDSLELVSWVVAAAMVLSSLLFIACVCLPLKLSMAHLMQSALLPGLVPYALAWLLNRSLMHWYAHVDRWVGVAWIFTTGVLYTALALALFWWVFSHPHERALIHTLAGKLIRTRNKAF